MKKDRLKEQYVTASLEVILTEPFDVITASGNVSLGGDGHQYDDGGWT